MPEDYVHRIGRTGRAGMPGEAISLVCGDELRLLADIEKLLKRPIPKLNTGGLEHRSSRGGDRRERGEDAERGERGGQGGHGGRSPRFQRDRDREERAPRVHERDTARAHKPAMVAADGFDFSKPYEPDAEPVAAAAEKPAAPKRGPARPVAALLGGLFTRK